MPERFTKVSRWPQPRRRSRKNTRNHILHSSDKAPWMSEIQDKGDLFYVEEYLERELDNAQTKHEVNRSELIKESRLGGSKFLDLLPGKKKSKQSLDAVSVEPYKKYENKNMCKNKKIDVKLHVNLPRIGPYKRDDLESVLGIIPLNAIDVNDRDELNISYEYGKDSRIIIAGFSPNGPAISHHELEIGDVILALNGLELNTNNANAMLGAIPGSMEVTLRVQKHSPIVPVSLMDKCRVANDNHLLKVVSHQKVDNKNIINRKEFHYGVMFLSLNISSEDEVEKDVLFQYPKDAKKIVSLRGIFLTLGDLLTSLTGSSPCSTSVIIDEKLVHIGYLKLNQEIFILALPSSRASLLHLKILMENLNQLFCFMFGSLYRAFCDGGNTLRLQHFFSLIFEFILGKKSIFNDYHKPFDSIEDFLSCTKAARWLDMPSQAQVHIDTCLNEIEANDFEWADEIFTMRRQYLVVGSCLFYKGVLIGNHIPPEDLQDIVLYCRLHCLFNTSEQQRLAQLVIWREVFFTKKKNIQQNSPLDIQPRTFLLIIGLKHFLICIILEAGIVSQRAIGNPGPDPYYINLAKNILYEVESLGIPSACESNLQNDAGPPTVLADHLLLNTKSGSVDKVTNSGKGKTVDLAVNFRSSGLDETDSVKSDLSVGNVGKVASPVHRNRTHRESSSSDGSKVANGSIEKMNSRINKSALTLAKLRKNTEDNMEVKLGFLNKLSSGEENTVFHYIVHNTFHGIVMSPFMTASNGKLHDEVLRNFNKACLKIRKHFRRHMAVDDSKRCSSDVSTKFMSTSIDSINEMGIQFNVMDYKKKDPVLRYWVKGRLFTHECIREFYVCYQDSAAQNMVELAFKLGFGSPI